VSGARVFAYSDIAAPDQYTLIVPSLGHLKALGVEIAKGIGEYAYITYWSDAGNLGYCVLDMLSGNVGAYDSLGVCTELELDNKTKSAYPQSIFFLDEYIMFYGRMTIGSGVYALVLSDDFGITKYPGIDNLGSRFVGAMHNDYGIVYFADCSLVDTKLAIGEFDFNNLTFPYELLSTADSTSLTNPNSLKYDFTEDAVWIVLGVDNSVKVIRSVYPFQEWFDFTNNHQITDGGTSLEIL
jgi:hypothetical protein